MHYSVMSSPSPLFRWFSVKLEREVTMSGFLGYKLQKTQLTSISSKDIYLAIQNLFNIYLLNIYCVPGTGSAYNRPSPCPQGVYILTISGQESWVGRGLEGGGRGMGVSGFVAVAKPCSQEPGSLHLSALPPSLH